MNIKVNEVRIGSLVNKTSKGFTEESLIDWIDICALDVNNKKYHLPIGLSITPIPLTTEKFIELGFQKEFTYLNLKISDELYLSFDTKLNELMVGCDDEWVVVENPKSVHKLQNIVFALTGNELYNSAEL